MSRRPGTLLPTLTVALLLAACSTAGGALPAAVEGQELPTLAPMLERATPAVVNIAVESRVPTRRNPLLEDPFFRRFFDLPDQPRERRIQSQGSGVVVDANNGYVVTNHHVIDQADVIMVTLRDGRRLQGRIVGSDPETDIAVIRIEASALTALPLANSDALRVGDFVVAIGNPFGLGQTVTSGIVSALGRTGLGIQGYEDFIQTDASINPGNSGGALVNLRGELVGINTAIIGPAGGNIGIGFAVPVNMVRTLMDQLIRYGEVSRGQLGVTTQDVTPELAEAFGIRPYSGAVITEVIAGSAAERAGLQAGDVVIAVGPRPVNSAGGLRNAIGLTRVGEQIVLEILRDGRPMTVRAEVRRPNIAAIQGAALHPRLEGAILKDIAPSAGGPARQRGVLLEQVSPGSPAARAGLRPGDLITGVNRQPVTDIDTLERLAGAANPGGLLLGVQRGRSSMLLLLR